MEWGGSTGRALTAGRRRWLERSECTVEKLARTCRNEGRKEGRRALSKEGRRKEEGRKEGVQEGVHEGRKGGKEEGTKGGKTEV